MAKGTATRSEHTRLGLAGIAALAALLASPAAAHDMWIAPERFVLGRGDTLSVRLLVGEALVSDESKPYAAERTTALVVHGPRGTVDLRAGIREGADPMLAARELRGRGEHLVAMGRAWTNISLPVDRFTHYLEHEGLGDVLEGRPALEGEQRERYRRSLKALVRVGRGKGGQLHARVIGQPFEIVLLDAPAKLRRTDRLRARLLLHGRPLPRHPLTAHVRDASRSVTSVTAQTDANGVAEFSATDGAWLLRSVHMSPCAGCRDAAWQSEWTAFAFAVGEG